MRERAGYPLLPLLLLTAFALVAAALSPSVARAEETQNLLHGPHPFLKDNELTVHALIGEGQGDALSGAKLELGYGYKLTGGRRPVLAQPAAQLRAQRLQSRRRAGPAIAPG